MAKVGSAKKLSGHVISSITNKSSGILPPQSKQKKLVNDPKASVDATIPDLVVKLSLGPLSNRSKSWDSLPINIQELGKVDCEGNWCSSMFVVHILLILSSFLMC